MYFVLGGGGRLLGKANANEDAFTSLQGLATDISCCIDLMSSKRLSPLRRFQDSNLLTTWATMKQVVTSHRRTPSAIGTRDFRPVYK